MTLKDLGIPTLAELEAMSDDQIRAHFSRFLEVCKPKFEVERKAPKKAKKPVSLTLTETDEVNKITVAKLQDLATKMGFGDMGLDQFIPKKK